jgi:hypothetical protein
MSALGFLAPLVTYAVITALHVVVPAREVDGYVIDPATGAPYRYRLNGLIVYAAHRRALGGALRDGPRPLGLPLDDALARARGCVWDRARLHARRRA